MLGLESWLVLPWETCILCLFDTSSIWFPGVKWHLDVLANLPKLGLEEGSGMESKKRCTQKRWHSYDKVRTIACVWCCLSLQNISHFIWLLYSTYKNPVWWVYSCVVLWIGDGGLEGMTCLRSLNAFMAEVRFKPGTSWFLAQGLSLCHTESEGFAIQSGREGWPSKPTLSILVINKAEWFLIRHSMKAV